MSTQAEIEATYNYMDEFWRLSVGNHADITCAMFDGDGTLGLEAAQRRKHDYIMREARFTPGARVLDIGCGWGGLLCTTRERGGVGVGLTLSSRQWKICRRAGLEVHLLDWRDAQADQLGTFDVVASVGAFEHFCSEEDYRAGRQEREYRRFFEYCARRLKPGRRMFLQTMTWGAAVPDPDLVRLDAPKGSDMYLLAVIRLFYPGSWLPNGVDQIARAASPWFSLVSSKNGRFDYILTMREWRRRLTHISLRKAIAAAKLLRYVVTDRVFLRRMELIRGRYNMRCFERNVMSHERIVLERSP